jgi:DNA-binding NarL/FixJ family response regulator
MTLRFAQGKPSFLIADDSPQKIMLITHMLKLAKWDGPILTSDNTEDAMRMIDNHKDIGFAFIDYYMPTKNGPAVIHYLKNVNPHARIALVSSSDKKSNWDEAIEAGAETCICTTYQSDVVEKAMLDLLEEWKNQN